LEEKTLLIRQGIQKGKDIATKTKQIDTARK